MTERRGAELRRAKDKMPWISFKPYPKKSCVKVSLPDEMSSLHINYIVITELLGGKEFLLLLAKIKIITDG